VNGRYVVDENGKRVGVLLDIKEYERMIEELEELEDILAYREAKAALESGEDEAIPLEQAMREVREGKVKGD
jgi:PHD/YefM family antitoxin component YafN of YafNO toxin-antitoxin module